MSSYSNIKDSDQLDEVILQLTAKSKFQKEELKLHFNDVVQSLKPANLIRSTFKDITQSPGFAKSALTGGLALGAGLLSKKMIIGRSGGFLKKMAGTLAAFALKRSIAKNSNKITATGVNLLKKLSHKS